MRKSIEKYINKPNIRKMKTFGWHVNDTFKAEKNRKNLINNGKKIPVLLNTVGTQQILKYKYLFSFSFFQVNLKKLLFSKIVLISSHYVHFHLDNRRFVCPLKKYFFFFYF